MPPVIRRRALSPRGLQTTTVGQPPSRGRVGRLFRLAVLFGMIGALVYFAVGFREAVDVAAEKMQALRASSALALNRGAGFSTIGQGVRGGISGLTSSEDVIELVRPKDDPTPPETEEEIDDDDVDEVEGEQSDASRSTGDDPNNSVSAEEETLEDQVPEQGDISEQSQQSVEVVHHEEDDAPVLDAGKIVSDDSVSIDSEVEEDLDTEEHAVDENANDVEVEGTPGDEDDENEDDESELTVDEGPQKMPKYKREELEEQGFGHVLYAYRVVAPYVAIRTKPSPIGVLALTSKDKMGLTKDSVKMGDIVVGYKLAKVHGLWLKIGPYTWAPVTKKDVTDGPFHPVMKQIRKISIPGNLRKYWRMRVVDCEGTYKRVDSRAACHDKNMIRAGVLNVMRRMKLIDSSMDPDLHPWPSLNASPRRTLHATSMTHIVDSSSEGDLMAANNAVKNGFTPQTFTDAQDSSALEQIETKVNSPIQTGLDERLEEEVKRDSDESQNPEGDTEEDDVDTDVECRSFKVWHLCARHAKCAWRRLPNQEYCDLDTDPPIDDTKLPKEMQQDPKYDFALSTKQNPMPKYFIYQPSGGWNNQRILMESALVICKLLNRTCILPPAAPHSNYYNNYNNIPVSALVGMPRVLNFEALNQVVPSVAIPRGTTFKEFLDTELFSTPQKYSVKTIFRDVTKYKPGTMKKWAEKDVIRMFGSDSSDVLYFSNQTLWGSIEWKGSLYGWPQRKQVQSVVMYPNHMKQIARKLAENLGPFHAVHIRRGDKVFEASFSRVYHEPDWYASRIAEYKSLAPKVYVATDEQNRSFFDAFKTHGMSMVFWESLPGFDNLLRPYLAKFPRRMFMDVLGMVEQLLCSYAILFLGSGYSTFTTYILRLRKYRDVIAADTSFEDRALGLPASVRSLKSSCDPLKSLGHSKPC